MSSNNALVILKKKGKYQVHMNACVDNEFKPSKSSLIETKEDLISAIKFAKRYCQIELVEYGYDIDDSCLK